MSHNLCLKGYGQCPVQTTTSQTRELLSHIPPGAIKEQALYVLDQYNKMVIRSYDSYGNTSKWDYESWQESILSMKQHIEAGSWNSLPFYSN